MDGMVVSSLCGFWIKSRMTERDANRDFRIRIIGDYGDLQDYDDALHRFVDSGSSPE